MIQGSVLDVTRSLTRNVNAYRWLPDGKGLLLEGFDGTRLRSNGGDRKVLRKMVY